MRLSVQEESSPTQAHAAPPPCCRSMELDPRLFGMLIALVVIWIVLRHLVRRHLPVAAEPVEPVGADRGRRDHGDRHGAGHRHPQHRPVDRLDARRRSACSWRSCRPSGCRKWIGFDHPLHLADHAGSRASRWGRRSGPSRGRSSPTRGCRRSSSRWAGCWSGVVWPGGWPRAAPSRRWTPTSSSSGGGSKGTIGGTWTWILAGVACAGIVAFLLLSRRRRSRSTASPCAPSGPTSRIGVVGCGAVIGVRVGDQQLPHAARRWPASTPRSNGIAWPEGGLEIPFGLANPGAAS